MTASRPKPGWPYSDPQWRQVRKLVLARDGNVCQFPKKVLTPRGWVQGICGMPASAVDHVVPWRAGGAPFDPANLRSSCVECNTSKANRGRKRGAARRRSAVRSAGAKPSGLRW